MFNLICPHEAKLVIPVIFVQPVMAHCVQKPRPELYYNSDKNIFVNTLCIFGDQRLLAEKQSLEWGMEWAGELLNVLQLFMARFGIHFVVGS